MNLFQITPSRFKFKRAFAFLLLIVIGSGLANAQTKKPPGKTRKKTVAGKSLSAKQKEAEAFVDQLQKRFYETLDFKTIWDEFYVKDRKLRELELDTIIGRYLVDIWSDKPRSYRENVSYEAMERAYIAFGNYWQTLSAFAFTNSNDKFKEVFSGEVGEIYGSVFQRSEPYKTDKELDESFTAKMNRISEIFRQHIKREKFNSDEYKEGVAGWIDKEPTQPPVIQYLQKFFAKAGLSKNTKLYAVDREVFHYYVLEEKGSFKMLTSELRRKF